MKKIIALSILISLLFCNFGKVDAVDTYELGDDVVATSSYTAKSIHMLILMLNHIID